MTQTFIEDDANRTLQISRTVKPWMDYVVSQILKDVPHTTGK